MSLKPLSINKHKPFTMIGKQTGKTPTHIDQVSLISIFLLLSSFCFQPVLAQPASDFALSTGSYPETADLEKIIKDRYGPGAKIADWSDIKSQFSASEIDNWADRIGLGRRSKSAYVQRNGDRWHSGGKRHYFIARHNGSKPSNFLAHDDIGDYIISLGSWYDMSKPVLIDLRGTRSGERFKRFEITSGSYPETVNLREIVKDRYGPSASVADWSDIKSKFSATEIANWADEIGLGRETKSVYVQWNGSRWHSGSKRHYFIARHNGDKPSNFLAHDDIGDYMISLGSWYDKEKPILVDTRGGR